MPLTKEEIETLLRLIAETDAAEINCEQCLALVAEFAERNLAGLTVDDGLQAVEQHLAVCEECREEYEALKRTLEELESDGE